MEAHKADFTATPSIEDIVNVSSIHVASCYGSLEPGVGCPLLSGTRGAVLVRTNFENRLNLLCLAVR